MTTGYCEQDSIVRIHTHHPQGMGCVHYISVPWVVYSQLDTHPPSHSIWYHLSTLSDRTHPSLEPLVHILLNTGREGGIYQCVYTSSGPQKDLKRTS